MRFKKIMGEIEMRIIIDTNDGNKSFDVITSFELNKSILKRLEDLVEKYLYQNMETYDILFIPDFNEIEEFDNDDELKLVSIKHSEDFDGYFEYHIIVQFKLNDKIVSVKFPELDDFVLSVSPIFTMGYVLDKAYLEEKIDKLLLDENLNNYELEN